MQELILPGEKLPLASLKVSFQLVITFPCSTGHQNWPSNHNNEQHTHQHSAIALLMDVPDPSTVQFLLEEKNEKKHGSIRGDDGAEGPGIVG